MSKDTININQGSGGHASEELISEIRKNFTTKSNWTNQKDDGAVYPMGKNNIVFTTDAYIISPIFFPGGDIGKIAISGTVNDISVMGARPSGLSLSCIIEEGF